MAEPAHHNPMDQHDSLLAQLAPLRAQIDALDSEILSLLSQRARIALQVGEVKKECGAPVFRPEREAAVLLGLAEQNSHQQGPLPTLAIERIYREIMSACRALERELVVAYLGPEGSYSQQAVLRQFGQSVTAAACVSFDEVFRAVEKGTADFGVVAVENSTEGVVNRTLDLLLQTSLNIVSEVSLKIEHQLLTQSGSMVGIERICAHPQALAQCHDWLNQHCPKLERQPQASNSEAARLAAVDGSVAAIAGELAAQCYGLGVVARQIQDEANNTTRFFVLGKNDGCSLSAPAATSALHHTSLIFSVSNQPGAVHAMLAPLAKHGVSMTRFESRPARLKESTTSKDAWTYYFYMDVEGHRDAPEVAAAIAELKALAGFFKILGSYPVFAA